MKTQEVCFDAVYLPCYCLSYLFSGICLRRLENPLQKFTSGRTFVAQIRVELYPNAISGFWGWRLRKAISGFRLLLLVRVPLLYASYP